MEDVVHGIKGLKLGSSTIGFLSVPALRAASELLAPCITALINFIPLAGCLPPSWPVSAITPILKPGDQANPDNYRGIAVATVLGMLYASLLYSRLSFWAESNGLRAVGQAGFREDHQCSD